MVILIQIPIFRASRVLSAAVQTTNENNIKLDCFITNWLIVRVTILELWDGVVYSSEKL